MSYDDEKVLCSSNGSIETLKLGKLSKIKHACYQVVPDKSQTIRSCGCKNDQFSFGSLKTFHGVGCYFASGSIWPLILSGKETLFD